MLKLGNDTFPDKVVPIDGDDSCLFSSISYLLYGNVQSSFVVRKAVVDYIISNWDRFKVFTHDHQGNNYPSREAYKTAMLNPMTYGSVSELQAASEVFSCRFQIFRNGHLFAVFGEHFETVKNIRFSGKILSVGHFDAYVFSSNNKEWEIFERNIKVPGKQKQVNPKMPPKRKRSVRYRTHKVKENMRRKRGNEAPLKQESRRESNRLRMARLRALETVQEEETRRSNCLQMQGRISESAEDQEERLECQRNVIYPSKMAIWKDKENAAYSYSPSIDYKSDASCTLGPMSITCQFCSAMKFKGEAPSLCCSGGMVHLPVLRDPPEPLHTLLSSDSVCAKVFQKNIRWYNSCFQMTSFGSSKQVIETGFMPTFKVQGQVYHRIGSIFPCPAEEPKFLQIYFIDSNTEQAEQRCRIVQQVKQDLVLKLQDMLQRNNSYIKSFKSAIEKLGPDFRIIIHADKVPAGEHSRRFNEPTTSEVAVIMAGDQHGKRDIVLETRNSSIKKIAGTHRSYDAL
ncbi:ATP-dependent DNA helicase PIF1 [Trichonephila clavipes]|nr:ATP-dependent DNA helicase PIF1 [Trichonephila clavipes]